MTDPLARYELGELLGTGATSEVFVAKDSKLRRDVAVKRLLPIVAEDPTVRTCFHREAQALARVRHKNVVAVHDYSGTDSDVLFLVMDYVRGKSLDGWLEQRGSIDEPILWAILSELSSALEACHAQNVVHRDLKPENVILTPSGALKLVDFGVARSYDSGDGAVAQSAGTQVMGTPDFMSPEQATSEQLTGASDVFSLGSVLYFLATGKRPFKADSVLATLKKIVAGDYIPAKQLRPALSDAFCSLLGRLMQKEIKDRPTASEISQAARKHLTQSNAKAEALLADWVTGGMRATQKMKDAQLAALFAQLGKALEQKEKLEIKRARKKILELDPDNDTVFEMSAPQSQVASRIAPTVLAQELPLPMMPPKAKLRVWPIVLAFALGVGAGYALNAFVIKSSMRATSSF